MNITIIVIVRLIEGDPSRRTLLMCLGL